jgi:hypothetical protein
VDVIKRDFYEFHPGRVVSRAGQEIKVKEGIEIGPRISRENALREVRSGKDVYTLAREDAYRLAVQVGSGKPRKASPTGRVDVYFRHYHPGGDHDRFGHIFFGQRGEKYIPKGFQILIKRKHSFAEGIVGELYANGKFICYTLELAWLWNQKDKSCVPNGKYDSFIRHDHSDKWRIELTGVPGSREHVQIHIGNNPKDILGCVLVGTQYKPDAVLHSKAAYQKLKDAYQHAHGPVTVEFEGILATPWGDYPDVRSNVA